MQEILKSLVAAPVDGGDLGQESGLTPYHPDPALKTHPMLPMQFHSFDRSVLQRALLLTYSGGEKRAGVTWHTRQ